MIDETYPKLHELLRPLSQEDIDTVLCAWNGNIESKHAVVRYMKDHAREKDTAAWLAQNTAAVTATACSLSVPAARRKRSCPGRRYSAGLPSLFRRTGSIPKKNRTVLTTSTQSPSGKLWKKEGSSTDR